MKYISILILLAVIACSPVRNRYMTRSNDKVENNSSENSNQTAVNQTESASAGHISNKDTVYIKLPPIYVNESNENINRSLSVELDSAIYLFNNGKYDIACEKFGILQETLKENDSLYHEAVFYSAECLIVHNEYKLANRLLNDIMNNELNSNLKQRVLLRQGHILCALGDESTAQWYFDKLKTDYPNSIYNKLADCNTLK
jgi:TolA-binding protein